MKPRRGRGGTTIAIASASTSSSIHRTGGVGVGPSTDIVPPRAYCERRQHISGEADDNLVDAAGAAARVCPSNGETRPAVHAPPGAGARVSQGWHAPRNKLEVESHRHYIVCSAGAGAGTGGHAHADVAFAFAAATASISAITLCSFDPCACRPSSESGKGTPSLRPNDGFDAGTADCAEQARAQQPAFHAALAASSKNAWGIHALVLANS